MNTTTEYLNTLPSVSKLTSVKRVNGIIPRRIFITLSAKDQLTELANYRDTLSTEENELFSSKLLQRAKEGKSNRLQSQYVLAQTIKGADNE